MEIRSLHRSDQTCFSNSVELEKVQTPLSRIGSGKILYRICGSICKMSGLIFI